MIALFVIFTLQKYNCGFATELQSDNGGKKSTGKFAAFRAQTFGNALYISHFKTFGKMKFGNLHILDAEGLFAAFAGEMEVVMNVAVSARVAKAVFAKARTIVNFVNYMVFRIGKKAQRAKNARPVHR